MNRNVLNLISKKLLIPFFLLLALHSQGQTLTLKDSFFLKQNKLPTDYKIIVGDTKGWEVISRFNCTLNKIENKKFPWDTLHSFIIYRDGNMYLKIRGNKIIKKGDKRVIYKILYVDKSILLIENPPEHEKIRGKIIKVKTRTLYKRNS